MSATKFKIVLDQIPYEVEQRGDLIVVNGQELTYKITGEPGKTGSPKNIQIAGTSHTVVISQKNAIVDGISYAIQTSGLEDKTESAKRSSSKKVDDGADGAIRAIMPGLIIKILKKAGDTVQANETVLILEAMKMQNEIKAPKAGTIQKVTVTQGESVETKQVLAILA